jgi:hypothetical protein
MKQTFLEFLTNLDTMCEVVYCDENGEILNEVSVIAFKRKGLFTKRYYRCTSGSKKGRLVATPNGCVKAKSAERVRHGKKVMRKYKNILSQKSKYSKRSSVTKSVTRRNKLVTHGK